METVSLDMAALANVTNAMVALVNENTKLKEINGLLAGRLKEIELEQAKEGEQASVPQGHEG